MGAALGRHTRPGPLKWPDGNQEAAGARLSPAGGSAGLVLVLAHARPGQRCWCCRCLPSTVWQTYHRLRGRLHSRQLAFWAPRCPVVSSSGCSLPLSVCARAGSLPPTAREWPGTQHAGRTCLSSACSTSGVPVPALDMTWCHAGRHTVIVRKELTSAPLAVRVSALKHPAHQRARALLQGSLRQAAEQAQHTVLCPLLLPAQAKPVAM